LPKFFWQNQDERNRIVSLENPAKLLMQIFSSSAEAI